MASAATPLDPPALGLPLVDPPLAPPVPSMPRLVAVPDAAPPTPRHILFLQGMPGAFFRLLGAEFATRGARVSRINFNGGDWADWHGEGTSAYRGTLAAWPGWLRGYLRDQEVTDIVVFGDCRDHHAAAHGVADHDGIRFWAFEEGYLRPDHVTLENGGVNGRSSFPRSLHAVRLLAERLPAPAPPEPVVNRFSTRAAEAVRHHVAAIAGRAFFPDYRTHRGTAPWREAVGWARRLAGRGAERRRSIRELRRLQGHPFFLHPLQIEGDSQLRFHSPFGSMVEAMEHVVAGFVTAPAGTMLLVKMHPLDPGVLPWRRLVTEAAAAAGIADRVVFVEHADLIDLLDRTQGVVTVNSTVGPLALERGVPVLALGDAIYRVPGITADDGLDAFWRAPPPVDAHNFALLTRALRAKCLVNGGFHSPCAVARLVTSSADTMLRP